MKWRGQHRGRWQIALGTIAAAIIAWGGMQLYLNVILDPYLENRLKDAVTRRSGGRYTLHYDDLSLHLWGRTLRMENARLLPADTPSTRPTVDMDRVAVKGIRYLSFLLTGEGSIGTIQLIRPTVTVPYVENGLDPLSELRSNVRAGLSRTGPVTGVDRVHIHNGSLLLVSGTDQTVLARVDAVTMDLAGLRADTASTGTDSTGAGTVTFESLHVMFGSMSHALPGLPYSLNSGRFALSTREQFCYIDSLQLRPELPRYAFSRNAGHEVDRVVLGIYRVALQKFDLETIWNGNLTADKLHVQGADLDVFRNKKMPAAIKEQRRFPHVQLQQLDLPVSIDTIAISDSRIRYSEQMPGISRPGSVSFQNLTATLYGVTNDSSMIREGRTIRMDVITDLMNSGPLSVHASFPLNANGMHTVRGRLGSMEVTELNPVLEPLGLVRARDGTIHNLDFRMEMGAEHANGIVRLKYSDLKLELLDREHVDAGGRQHLASFLANTFKIPSDNITPPLKEGTVRFDREPDKSIFHYWWKSLASGLKDTIGL